MPAAVRARFPFDAVRDGAFANFSDGRTLDGLEADSVSGHHPFSDLTRDFSPEQKRRVESIKAELVAEMNPPPPSANPNTTSPKGADE